ncbi:peptide ABC transporter permease [Haloferax volcanii DS2]|uniref:Peptide ABC transporter permease n=1 Tax=Haloferax volcanii (strain ATCC 29605 / DSM 3757 / JCM 8879 / NBRC 14742 / NCIMB 2012 / VKM B-1768 / DS2) TaxID=309800 RepID=L9VH33_HALVD|nr:peptide ABC transporter permease [Haloferax volcanii DS2]
MLVLFGVSALTYGFVFLTPGDPAVAALSQQLGHQPSAAAVEQFRATHGLNRPLPVRYADWLSEVARGDFGTSYQSGRPVRSMLVQRLPNTVELAVASTVVAVAVAVPAGVTSAVRAGGYVDDLTRVASLVGVSMPNFWLGYLLIIGGALQLGLFPVSGAGDISHLVLPAVTLGSGMAGVIARLVRTSILDTLGTEYVRTARSKGLHERVVVYKHAFRNALVPVVTVIGLQFGYVLNGAVVVEAVFQRPGLGTLLVDAVFARDYPVVQGVTLLVGVAFVSVNLLVDLTYRYLDPRIDIGGTRP